MAYTSGVRKISTTFKTPKKGGEQVRIRIPQPIKAPINIRGKDVVNQDLLRGDMKDYTLHKRFKLGALVGDADPRERRAVSETQVRGSLPERILYLYLVKNMHMKSGVDFDFQSSQEGGRMELGGIVCDFLFENMKMVINVQGPTHNAFLRGRKDEEQRGILQSMGYTVYDITDEEIYNEAIFSDKIRRLFNMSGSGGGGYSYEHIIDEDPSSNDYLMLGAIMDEALKLHDWITWFNG